jgi:hypothetical protein
MHGEIGDCGRVTGKPRPVTSIPDYSRLISASGNDPRVFYHDYHRALRSPRSVHDTFGNDEALPRAESYQPPFEIDQKLTLNDVKKLVVLFVFVPMVFTTKNPQPHD